MRRPRRPPPSDFEELLQRQRSPLPVPRQRPGEVFDWKRAKVSRVGSGVVLLPDVLREAVKVMTRGQGERPVIRPLPLPTPEPPPKPPRPTRVARPPPAPPPPPVPPIVVERVPPHADLPAPPPIASPGPFKTPVPTPIPLPSPSSTPIPRRAPTSKRRVSAPTKRRFPWPILPIATKRSTSPMPLDALRLVETTRSRLPSTLSQPLPSPTPSPTPISPTPLPTPSPQPSPSQSPTPSELTAVTRGGVGSLPPDDECRRCERERERRRRPSRVVATVKQFSRRMSQWSLDNLKRGK